MVEIKIYKDSTDLINWPYRNRKFLIMGNKIPFENLIDKDKKEYTPEDFFKILMKIQTTSIANLAIRGAVSFFIDVYDYIKSNKFPENAVSIFEKNDDIFEFPLMHPVKNSVYVVNPIFNNRYHLLQSFHSDLFQEKAMELVRILRNLGARRINIEHVEGMSLGGGFSINVSENKLNVDINNKSDKKISWISEYPKSNNLPILPKNLGWYNFEPGWREIAESRIENGLEKFNTTLEYSNDFGVTAEISGKFKEVINLGGNFSSATKSLSIVSGEFWPACDMART